MKGMRKFLALLLTAAMMMVPFAGMADVLNGSAQGMMGTVSVAVTVEGGAITAVEVTEQNETPEIGTKAVDQLPAAIVAANSADVDGVSGATITSNAIKLAVENALNGVAAEEKAEAELTIEPDVIIIGGGIGGMATATRLLQLGKKVVLFEKTSRLGGCLHFAGGSISAAGYKMQKENGIEDTADAYYTEIYNMNNGENLNLDMLRTYCDNCAAALDWLDEEVGVDFGDRHIDGGGYQQTSAPRVTYAMGMSATGGAYGFLNAFTARLDEYAAAGTFQLILDAEVTELVAENGAVVGVRCGDKEFRAANTVLATGGYGAGEEWLKKTIFSNVCTSDPETSDGAGMTLAASVGAAMGNMDYISPYIGAIPVSGFTCTLRANTSYPGCLWVNKAGQRMVNEPAAAMDSKLSGSIWVGTAEENIVYVVVSEDMLNNDTAILRPAMGGAALANNGWDRFAELTEEGKYIIKADTIEELAQLTGMTDLPATVAQYNQDCAAGRDSAFGREANLVALDKGPFYALFTVPWVLQSAGGVVINESAQVVREDGSVIDGLYAVGELIGSANIDGHVTVGGFIHSMCVTFAKIAAETIAK